MSACMLIPHKGHTDTIQVYSVTVMTHVKALQAGHSSQGTSEPITPACVPADQVVAAVIVPPVGPGNLEALLRRLLPTAPVQTPPPRTVPTEMEILLERLLSGAPAPAPTPTPRTGITGMEALLQHLLPGTPVPASARRDWTMIVCVFLWQTWNWMKHSRTFCRDGRRRRWAPIA